MAKRHRDILTKLDPVAVNRYQITEKDIRLVEQYLKTIQRGFGASTWQNIIDFESPYATCIIVHEVVEIRLLQARGHNLLKLDTDDLRNLLDREEDAHVAALYEESLYLQEYISRTYQQHFEVATLIRANREDDTDFQRFIESDIGIYIFEEDRVEEAREILDRLKGGNA